MEASRKNRRSKDTQSVRNPWMAWSKQAFIDALIILPLVIATIVYIIYRRPDPYNALSNDLLNYSTMFNNASWYSLTEYIKQYRFEPGFTTLVKAFSALNLNFNTFHIVLQLIFYWVYYRFLRSLMPFSRLYPFLALLAAIWLPTFAIIANQAMRQTWAMVLLFLALAQLLWRARNSEISRPWSSWSFVTLLAAGVLFHYSMAVVTVLILASLLLPFRVVVIGWTVALALYCTNYPGLLGLLQAYLYPIFQDNSTVTAGAEAYRLGFKTLFLLMSGVPFAALLWARALNISLSRPLLMLYHLYFGVNTFCLMLSFLPYHDRFFHYTWALIPAIALGTLSETVIHVRIKRTLSRSSTLLANGSAMNRIARNNHS